MNTSIKHRESSSERNRQKVTNRNMFLAMGLLLVTLLLGSAVTSSPNEGLTAMKVIWGIVSAIAFAGLIGAMFSSYSMADERQKLVHLKTSSLTFIAVIFSLFIAQILNSLDIVYFNVSTQVIVVGGIVLWVYLIKLFERRDM